VLFQAVPLSWSILLFRPVTLRRHLSVVLPLSDSWCDYHSTGGHENVTGITGCRARSASGDRRRGHAGERMNTALRRAVIGSAAGDFWLYVEMDKEIRRILRYVQPRA